MKVYSTQSVYDATVDRIKYVFDEFPEVLCAFSGGKDSTVILEMGIAEARRRGQLPMKVVFIDQEAEWTDTIEYVEEVAGRPDVEMWWIQIPLEESNSSSFEQEVLDIWHPDKEAVWIRPKSPLAVTENIFGEYQKGKKLGDFYRLFDVVYPKVAEEERYAVLYGLRASESPLRSVNLTAQRRYKKVTWATGAGKSGAGSYKFAAIYDWSSADIWTAIARNEWPYNANYDKQFQLGVSPLKMRVSSLTHSIAAERSLQQVQALDPDLYDRLVQRIPGIDTAAHLMKDIKVRKLPAAFASYEEYAQYMLDNLISPEMCERFVALLNGAQCRKAVHDSEFWAAVCASIQAGDYYGTTMESYFSKLAIQRYGNAKRVAKKVG